MARRRRSPSTWKRCAASSRATPSLQADVFRNVAAAADAAPTTTNRLLLALALATPTHPSSDARKRSGS